MAIEDWIDFDYEDAWDLYSFGYRGSHSKRRRPTKYGTLVAPTINETEKAWLVRVGPDEIWLPKSQCQRSPEGEGGDTYTIPEWLVEAKGIDRYVDFD